MPPTTLPSYHRWVLPSHDFLLFDTVLYILSLREKRGGTCQSSCLTYICCNLHCLVAIASVLLQCPCQVKIVVVLPQKLPPHPTTIPATLSHHALISATSSILLQLQKLSCTCCHIIVLAATLLQLLPLFWNLHHRFVIATTVVQTPSPFWYPHHGVAITTTFLKLPQPFHNPHHLVSITSIFS